MNKIILDSGPLGKLCHPHAAVGFISWFQTQMSKGSEIIISEIADYEVRRELIRIGKHASIRALDGFKHNLTYLPIDTLTMLRAAELWAEARNRGKPMADRHALDCDVILAAQAERSGAVIATENVGHLAQFVDAKSWEDIT